MQCTNAGGGIGQMWHGLLASQVGSGSLINAMQALCEHRPRASRGHQRMRAHHIQAGSLTRH